MKVKNLIIIFGVVLGLLVYNLICYKLVNSIVEKDTKNIISSYINNKDFKYLKIYYLDNNFNIYIKDKNNYYKFILDNNYNIIEVNNKVPLYIR